MIKMAASEFKAKCLGVLDEVQRTGESVVILKRGKPVAELVAITGASDDDYPQNMLKGSVKTLEDIVAPPLPEHDWEALTEP